DSRTRKLTLKKDHTREDLLAFQKELVQFLGDYKVQRVVIEELLQKGKFSGGATSFNLEATIQLIPADYEVELLSATQIKSILAANTLPVHFADTGLKQFQEAAFLTAYAGHFKDWSPSGPAVITAGSATAVYPARYRPYPRYGPSASAACGSRKPRPLHCLPAAQRSHQ